MHRALNIWGRIEMKKVVIFHHVGNMGGGTISLVDVCKMLHHEYHLTVLLPRRGSEMLTELLGAYAEVKHYDQRMPLISHYSGSERLLTRSFFSSYFVSGKGIADLCEMILAENPDIVLANSLIQCRMGYYLKTLRAKKVIYIRETFTEDWISQQMIRMVNRYFDGVLCISPYEKEYARFVIPTAVVADVFSPPQNKYESQPSGDTFRILFMGGSAQIKGLSVLAGAMEHIRSKRVRFDICGNVTFTEPTLRNWMLHAPLVREDSKTRSLLQKHDAIIQYHGFVQDMGKLICGCDAVVFPSTFPHQARPALEAGYYGKPVILSDFRQTACFYQHQVNGLLFKPNDPKALAQVIDQLAETPELAEELGKNNHESYCREHQFSGEQQKLLNFLQELENE